MDAKFGKNCQAASVAVHRCEEKKLHLTHESFNEKNGFNFNGLSYLILKITDSLRGVKKVKKEPQKQLMMVTMSRNIRLEHF